MRTKQSTKGKPQTFAQLAEVLGVSRQLLNAHRKKSDAPKMSDVAGWVAYLAAHGREGSAPPELREAIAKARLAILRETQAKLKRENDTAAGLLMERAEARRENASAWAHVFEMIDRRLCNEYPPMLAGCEAVPIFEKLCAFREELRRNCKDRFEKAA
jgi:hypothetical protein